MSISHKILVSLFFLIQCILINNYSVTFKFMSQFSSIGIVRYQRSYIKRRKQKCHISYLDTKRLQPTNLFHGRTHRPQHFSRPSKFFSASFISWLIWSMPSSMRSNCSEILIKFSEYRYNQMHMLNWFLHINYKHFTIVIPTVGSDIPKEQGGEKKISWGLGEYLVFLVLRRRCVCASLCIWRLCGVVIPKNVWITGLEDTLLYTGHSTNEGDMVMTG